MNSESYSRTVSGEEARKGWLFVSKDSLAMFPGGGMRFDLQYGSSVRSVTVESYPCSCRGAGNPHRHYFIPCAGLNPGDQVTVRKDERKAGRYVLVVRSTAGQKEFCG